MFPGRDQYICCYYKLCFEHIPNLRHIQVCNPVDFPDIRVNKNKLLECLHFYTDCSDHKETGNMDSMVLLLQPLKE